MNKFYSMTFSHRFLIKEIIKCKKYEHTPYLPILTPHTPSSITKPPPLPLISFGTPPNTPPYPPLSCSKVQYVTAILYADWLIADCLSRLLS